LPACQEAQRDFRLVYKAEKKAHSPQANKEIEKKKIKDFHLNDSSFRFDLIVSTTPVIEFTALFPSRLFARLRKVSDSEFNTKSGTSLRLQRLKSSSLESE